MQRLSARQHASRMPSPSVYLPTPLLFSSATVHTHHGTVYLASPCVLDPPHLTNPSRYSLLYHCTSLSFHPSCTLLLYHCTSLSFHPSWKSQSSPCILDPSPLTNPFTLPHHGRVCLALVWTGVQCTIADQKSNMVKEGRIFPMSWVKGHQKGLGKGSLLS